MKFYIYIPLFIISFSACTFETPKDKIVSNEDLDCNHSSLSNSEKDNKSKFTLDLNLWNESNELDTSKLFQMVRIPSGSFLMGSEHDSMALPREKPAHKVEVKSFYMDVHEVTNFQYKKFVDATGYITIAERPIDWEEMKKQLPPGTKKPSEDDLQPGSLVFSSPKNVVNLADFSNWWKWVKGACWKHPLGPESGLVKDYQLKLNGSGLQKAGFYPTIIHGEMKKLIVEKLNATTGQEHFLQKILKKTDFIILLLLLVMKQMVMDYIIWQEMYGKFVQIGLMKIIIKIVKN